MRDRDWKRCFSWTLEERRTLSSQPLTRVGLTLHFTMAYIVKSFYSAISVDGENINFNMF